MLLPILWNTITFILNPHGHLFVLNQGIQINIDI